ncbi:unnamed protein product [Allacma fusca]|uniref:2-oxo-4-hydroxy-4-carboxy-5-ureidoimidazoline decarboxylase n=1 Tax=Allacma fusca TaxID=39272 RepID=A0A8J2PLH8_9HEXA|nr:unnamed protein product [Allacma fusca]
MSHSIQQVNEMKYEEFLQVFGNVVEHCALCAAAIWAHRPFYNVQELHAELCHFIDNLPSIGREGILRLHPDLAGRIAQLGLLTSESKKEQLSAGLDTLTEDERETIMDLNERYKEKFGFPFVICARDNKKHAILTGLKIRIENTSEVEVTTGVEEVKKIMMYRLLDLVKTDN